MNTHTDLSPLLTTAVEMVAQEVDAPDTAHYANAGRENTIHAITKPVTTSTYTPPDLSTIEQLNRHAFHNHHSNNRIVDAVVPELIAEHEDDETSTLLGLLPDEEQEVSMYSTALARAINTILTARTHTLFFPHLSFTDLPTLTEMYPGNREH